VNVSGTDYRGGASALRSLLLDARVETKESFDARPVTQNLRRRRVVLLLASVALAVVLLAGACGDDKFTVTRGGPTKPNFVFILADDMRKDDLRYMPKTLALLEEKGMRFANAYVSNALCCPSRATIMRGQYSHNTGVWSNVPPDGGWQGYHSHGNEQDNIATRLHNAGYSTALLGKYLNHYKGTAVPPGWDEWFATFTFEYYNYDVNDNGTIRHFGTAERAYHTDVVTRQTQQFIDASVARGRPFFAYVAPIAPHAPAIPAPRDQHAFDGEKGPRLPSFNERDVSDKPPWVQRWPRLGAGQIASIDHRHERRVESLQALDDLVEAVVSRLRGAGAMKDTYVVFTSDNGLQEGEHRVPEEKTWAYEQDTHVPLLIRGPGIQAGSTTHKLTLNTDFFPTFSDLADIRTPNYVDGRSLRSILKGNATTAWRTAILLERLNPYPDQLQSPYAGRSFSGIRTSSGMKYIEYKLGPRELYDLKTDPYELTNSYDATAPPKGLTARLDALKGCAGDACREAENRP
jgi:N-acetylglucosamine-6-sulfatase